MGKELGLAGSISIGIGAMIGGGIFSVLGLSVETAKKGAPLSFLIGGFLSVLVGYCYIKFSSAYHVEGGSFSYIGEALNIRIGGFSGWLLSIGYIFTITLYAYAFGAYGAALIGVSSVWRHILQTTIILIFLGVNLVSVKSVGKIEKGTVLLKVTILILFVIFGLIVSKSASGAVEGVDGSGIVMAAALIFVAFEGFQLIPQGIKEMKNPDRTIKISIYLSILTVTALYIAIAFIVSRTLSVAEITASKDYVLAAAAEPLAGSLGYTIIGFAAIISTASAINATLFGTSRLTFIMATKKELPAVFSLRRQTSRIPIGALIGISLIAIILVNILTLVDIASITSSIFLLIFILMGLATIKKRKELGSNLIIPASSSLFCTISLVFLLNYTLQNSLLAFTKITGVFLATLVLETLFKKTAIEREYLFRQTQDIGEKVIEDSQNEANINIRNKIIRELEEIRYHIRNIDDYTNGHMSLLKKIKDDLDTFTQKIEYSITGRKYSIFTPQYSAWLSQLQKYDREMVEKVKDVTRISEELEKKLGAQKDYDLERNLVLLREKISESRQAFKSRMDFIHYIRDRREKL